MSAKQKLNIDDILTKFTTGVSQYIQDSSYDAVRLIGIRTGGVWLAQRIASQISGIEPPGELNIAFYRDDFSRIGMHPTVEPSVLQFDVNDKHLLLIDDILFTGRTVRAAMNEIFDYGRPASIGLAVLVDRGGRELPVQADVIGTEISLAPNEHVKLNGPEPLKLELCKVTS
ncbi:MAG: bifunctional pyr operon transcriptional regulator/uracil phosphoribosyltransferase PyrR [Pseudomonadota bacterium]